VVSLPEVLVALYALPEVAHRIGSVFRSLFGIDTLDTAVTDTTAFGEDWQFDLDAVVIQFGELTPMSREVRRTALSVLLASCRSRVTN